MLLFHNRGAVTQVGYVINTHLALDHAFHSMSLDTEAPESQV